MAHLELRLFGIPGIVVGGRVQRPRSAKTLALLAFLALDPGRAHARAGLATLLWGGYDDAAARHSLRQALYSLGAMAGKRLSGWIDTSPDSVRLLAHPEVMIDALRFLALTGAPGIEGWREAAAIYRGPLLDGSPLRDCEAYEAWRAEIRDRYQALAIQNLDRLVRDAISRADWDGARRDAQSLRALDPARETTSRHLMRILAASGDAAGLETEWARVCAALERDFGAAPSAATTNLYRTLGGGERSRGDGPRTVRLDADSFLRAARAAERVHAYGHAVELYQRAIAILGCPDEAHAARGEALLCLERVLERLGRRTEQLAVIEEALGVSAALGEPGRRAAALLRKAGACAYLDDIDEARLAASCALDSFRELGDRPGEAEALRELGFVHWRAEAYAEALDCTRAALALHRSLGDVSGEATALHNLAEILRGLGSPRQSLEWYGEALPLHWASANHAGEIVTLFGWANALQQSGDSEGARAKYEAALGLSERYGERTMQSRALRALAMHWCAQGDLEQALRFMRQALDVARAIHYAHGLGHDLVDLSDIHRLRGESAEARAALQEALVWFEFVRDRDALEAAGKRLDDLAAGRPIDVPRAGRRGWVRSHLPLAEGKVYCEFESPMARAARA